MRLELDSSDLRSEHANVPTSAVTYDKLKDNVQEVVRLVGTAIYFTPNRNNHNVVRPPREQTVRSE